MTHLEWTAARIVDVPAPGAAVPALLAHLPPLRVLRVEIDDDAAGAGVRGALDAVAARHAGSLRALLLGADHWPRLGAAAADAYAALLGVPGPVTLDLSRCDPGAVARADALAAIARLSLDRDDRGHPTNVLTPLHADVAPATAALLHAVAGRPRCRLEISEGACDDRLRPRPGRGPRPGVPAGARPHRITRSLYSRSDTADWFDAPFH